MVEDEVLVEGEALEVVVVLVEEILLKILLKIHLMMNLKKLL